MNLRTFALLLTAACAFAQQQAEPAKDGGITLQLQGQNPRQSQSPGTTARTAAPFDLTGYWVSVVNEDWRWRMMTPPKGDFSSVPLNIEGRRVADQWDPAKDQAAGEQCRVYGAPSLMRLPTRLHITWAGDNTLKIETDAGTQTRLLHFGEPAESLEPSGLEHDAQERAAQERNGQVKRTWQGLSLAAWEADGAGAPNKNGASPTGPRDLKITTSNLRAGYLRRNGIPYSANAKLTEYIDIFPKMPNGDEWMVLTSIVDDPIYLTERYITSSNFKREPDAAKWHPTPCATR